MWCLDEALFAVPGVLDYRASLNNDESGSRLELMIHANAVLSPPELSLKIEQAVNNIPMLAQRLTSGDIRLHPIEITTKAWASDGSAKRSFLPPTN